MKNGNIPFLKKPETATEQLFRKKHTHDSHSWVNTGEVGFTHDTGYWTEQYCDCCGKFRKYYQSQKENDFDKEPCFDEATYQEEWGDTMMEEIEQ